MKKNNQEKEEELLFIRDWCLTIINYLDSISNTNYTSLFKSGILKGYEAKNLRGMRLALKDITQMAMHMDSQNVKRINNLLKDRFGRDLNDESGETQKTINKIIKRQEILNADEFRIIKEKVEEIYSDENKAKELEQLNELLFKYENRKQ